MSPEGQPAAAGDHEGQHTAAGHPDRTNAAAMASNGAPMTALLAPVCHTAGGSAPTSNVPLHIAGSPGDSQSLLSQSRPDSMAPQGASAGVAAMPAIPLSPQPAGAPRQLPPPLVAGSGVAGAAAEPARQPSASGFATHQSPLMAAIAAASPSYVPPGLEDLPVLPNWLRQREVKNQLPLVCQVLGCDLDLTTQPEYYQRLRICRDHLKAPAMLVEGAAKRFCQQCGKFHELTAFDGDRRNCRARLEQHNSRRRKVAAASAGGQAAASARRNLIGDADMEGAASLAAVAKAAAAAAAGASHGMGMGMWNSTAQSQAGAPSLPLTLGQQHHAFMAVQQQGHAARTLGARAGGMRRDRAVFEGSDMAGANSALQRVVSDAVRSKAQGAYAGAGMTLHAPSMPLSSSLPPPVPRSNQPDFMHLLGQPGVNIQALVQHAVTEAAQQQPLAAAQHMGDSGRAGAMDITWGTKASAGQAASRILGAGRAHSEAILPSVVRATAAVAAVGQRDGGIGSAPPSWHAVRSAWARAAPHPLPDTAVASRTASHVADLPRLHDDLRVMLQASSAPREGFNACSGLAPTPVTAFAPPYGVRGGEQEQGQPFCQAAAGEAGTANPAWESVGVGEEPALPDGTTAPPDPTTSALASVLLASIAGQPRAPPPQQLGSDPVSSPGPDAPHPPSLDRLANEISKAMARRRLALHQAEQQQQQREKVSAAGPPPGQRVGDAAYFSAEEVRQAYLAGLHQGLNYPHSEAQLPPHLAAMLESVGVPTLALPGHSSQQLQPGHQQEHEDKARAQLASSSSADPVISALVAAASGMQHTPCGQSPTDQLLQQQQQQLQRPPQQFQQPQHTLPASEASDVTTLLHLLQATIGIGQDQHQQEQFAT